jgi:hypothetical protein
MSLKITFHLTVIAKIAYGKIHGFKKYREIVGNIGSFNENYFNSELSKFKQMDRAKLVNYISKNENHLGEKINVIGECDNCRDRHSCRYVIDGDICIK